MLLGFRLLARSKDEYSYLMNGLKAFHLENAEQSVNPRRK
jgi:hypothetical protein